YSRTVDLHSLVKDARCPTLKSSARPKRSRRSRIQKYIGTRGQSSHREIVHPLFAVTLADQHLLTFHQKVLPAIAARFRDRLFTPAPFDGDAPRARTDAYRRPRKATCHHPANPSVLDPV